MIRVERLGALPPSANADVVREQIRLAHRYRNTLVEVERGRRAAMRDAEERAGLRAATDALAAAEGRVEEVLARVAVAKSEARSRAAVPKPLRDELAAAKTEASAARAAFRALRASIRDASIEAGLPLRIAREALDAAKERARTAGDRAPAEAAERAVEEARAALIASGSLAGEVERINGLAGELRRSARAHCGLYWGTYLLVEAAMDDAAKAPLWERGQPNDPRFERFTGEGAVGVQIQGGASLADIEGDGDTRLRVGPAEMPPHVRARVERKRARLGDPSWQPRAGRDVATMRTLWLRVGSTDDRSPVWATFPVRLSRPLPEGARVKGAAVHVRLVGEREEWYSTLTLDVPETSRTERCGEGAVAVHLGWRRIGEELRVAVALGADGAREEVSIPEADERGLTLPRGIRRIRDRHLEAIRPALAAALRGADGLTGRLADDARSLHQWRSHGRLRAFVRRWCEAGAPGGAAPCAEAAAWRALTPEPYRARLPQGDTVRDAAVAWAYHDRHLLDYEAGQRSGADRRRRERYRVFAAQLARRYAVLVLDDADRSELARRPRGPRPEGAEVPAQQEDAAQSNRVLAAVSVLEGALKNAFRARGGRVVEVGAAGETRTCARCGGGLDVDPSAVKASCAACGAAVDQDDNAARNMLAACERLLSAEMAGAARNDDEPRPASTSRGSKRFERRPVARGNGAQT